MLALSSPANTVHGSMDPRLADVQMNLTRQQPTTTTSARQKETLATPEAHHLSMVSCMDIFAEQLHGTDPLFGWQLKQI